MVSEKFLDMINQSNILEKWYFKYPIYILFWLWGMFIMYIFSTSIWIDKFILWRELVNFSNIESISSIILWTWWILSLFFILILMSIWNWKIDIEYKEMVEKIYNLLEKDIKFFQEKGFEEIRKNPVWKQYKRFLKYKYKKTEIAIALHHWGNLYIDVYNSENQKIFLNKNTNWEKTETYASQSVYKQEDLNVLSEEPKDVLEKIKKYAELIQDTFK